MRGGLTCDWLGDNGGVVVRMVARVEEVVVQRAVEPVVEELHGPRVQQRRRPRPVRPPQREPPHARHRQVPGVEEQPVEDDLVVPPALAVHLVELDAAVDDAVLDARGLVAGQADPDLVVDHPQKQSW